MLAPVFSYQYNYPFFNKECALNNALANNAAKFIRHNCDKNTLNCTALNSRINHYYETERALKISLLIISFIARVKFTQREFYLVNPDYNNLEVTYRFPVFSTSIKQYLKEFTNGFLG